LEQEVMRCTLDETYRLGDITLNMVIIRWATGCHTRYAVQQGIPRSSRG
jgi:hypothetical protein